MSLAVSPAPGSTMTSVRRAACGWPGGTCRTTGGWAVSTVIRWLPGDGDGHDGAEGRLGVLGVVAANAPAMAIIDVATTAATSGRALTRGGGRRRRGAGTG